MDPVSLAIGVGLAVSLMLTELFGLAAGGMVVPGYLAVFFDRPMVVVLTLFAALATWGVAKLVSRFVVVYGKRRTALMILVGFMVGCALRGLTEWLVNSSGSGLAPADFAVIGYVVPGLIAIWIDRQGVVETTCVVLTAGAVVRLVLSACGLEVIA